MVTMEGPLRVDRIENMSETEHWKVQGMSCTNCALSIEKYLEKEGRKM